MSDAEADAVAECFLLGAVVFGAGLVCGGREVLSTLVLTGTENEKIGGRVMIAVRCGASGTTAAAAADGAIDVALVTTIRAAAAPAQAASVAIGASRRAARRR